MTDALTHLTHLSSTTVNLRRSLSNGDDKEIYPAHRKSASGASVRQELDTLATAVGRLSPDRRDPERFHMDRSEIVHELRRLARVLA